MAIQFDSGFLPQVHKAALSIEFYTIEGGETFEEAVRIVRQRNKPEVMTDAVPLAKRWLDNRLTRKQ